MILIQNPGVRQGTSTNYGSGWDVILPQNWSKAFWVAFIYRGARAAGLRDLESLAFEQKAPLFPHDFPDTKAGNQYEKDATEKLKTKYDRRPPAKRCNYIKLGITSPFSCQWCNLIQDWNGGQICKNILILRDWRALKRLREIFNKPFNKKHLTKSNLAKTDVNNLSEVLSDTRHSLVQVELTMLSKGVPNDYAVICIPAEEDFRQLQSDNSFSGPKEPVHKDDSTKSKKKSKGDILVTNCTNKSKSIRHSCSREVIGYVNRGGFALGSGNGSGLGFCAVSGIKHLLEKSSSESSNFVLVRNPTSYQYRYASIKIT